MFIRSLTLATLLAVAGPILAADNDGPLTQDLGKSRPLIVIAPSTVDPTLVSLKKSLDEPANRQAFNERNMVLYTVINTIGQRDGKDIDPQSTMALIRSLKLGAGAQTKVILVGKDGEKKLEHSGAIELKEVFSAVDQLPAAEKQAAAPAPAPEPEAKPASAKAGKAAKPAAAPKALDD
ncbi:DUF4174 domain-containing protein [Pseudomonas chlororaphis]|uniref:DUF4174 domain-containing protein n=1 Tax=Pseudomonas chlororaphis TaxID=587753 RepID=UPI00209B548C|nr:DUF4174 domain-containing protein [Pseudomonas chlororaphis]MCO7612728.1 DUF4174 domain-containing protein [Pseudomonas chlororaphis]